MLYLRSVATAASRQTVGHVSRRPAAGGRLNAVPLLTMSLFLLVWPESNWTKESAAVAIYSGRAERVTSATLRIRR